MKANALRIGKALSAALFVLLLVVAGTKNALAQTQVAILQHGEDISEFYGQNAFVDAHNAAETGDVITLSSGTFTPCDITKAITLRGAGCVIDTVSGTYPTIIPNSFQMNVSNDTAFLTVEGIFFSGTATYYYLNHPKFVKCNFEFFDKYYRYSVSGSMQYGQFVNCKFAKFNYDGANNSTLINCVSNDSYGMGSLCSIIAYNSFIGFKDNTTGASALNAYNCVIDGTGWHYLEGNSVAYNCIGIFPNTNNPNGLTAFGNIQTFNCMNVFSYPEIFETFNGEFSFDEPFILKDEIATGFLGNDGTQVGIYGGIMPYTSRPSYMVIEHCNVANRSTIDGKLSVEIEVVTEGE